MDLFEPVLTPLLIPDGRGGRYQAKGYKVPSEYLIDNISLNHPLWKKLIGTIASKTQDRILVPELEDIPIDSVMISDIKIAYLGVSSGAKTIFSQRVGQPDARYMPPSSGGLGNTELSRTYVRYCLSQAREDGKVGRGFRRHDHFFQIPPPLFFEPGPIDGRHHGCFAYVDLASAYWSIHQKSTIDMKFNPGSWALGGRAFYLDVDEVTAYRQIRRIIPGLLRSGSCYRYKHGKPSDVAFRGDLCYPEITGYTMYTMHAIAQEVVDNFGALMVMTDGYIIPEERAEELVEFLWERWGMRGVIKARGEGALYSMNVYQVGIKHTIHAPATWTDAKEWTFVNEKGTMGRMRPVSNPKNNLLAVDSGWMNKRNRMFREHSYG